MINPALTTSITAPKISPRAWLIFWLIIAVLQALLLANNASLDTLLWRTTRWAFGDQSGYNWSAYKTAHATSVAPLPFYQTTNPPFTRTLPDGTLQARLYQRTAFVWQGFKDFGEISTTFFIILIVSLYSSKKWKAGLMMFAAPLLAGGIGTLIRMIAGRYRPNAQPLPDGLFQLGDGINHWSLLRGFHETRDLSYPSGHAGVAFATAAVLCYLSPKGRFIFLALATGTAISRVIMLAHFPADVIMASAVGWTIGWLTTVLLDHLIKDPLPAL